MVGLRPPCWCPSGWAPTWRLFTNLYKFGSEISLRILCKETCCDLHLGENLCIFPLFLVPDSGRYLFNGFDLILIYFEWRDTENQYFLQFMLVLHSAMTLLPLNCWSKEYLQLSGYRKEPDSIDYFLTSWFNHELPKSVSQAIIPSKFNLQPSLNRFSLSDEIAFYWGQTNRTELPTKRLATVGHCYAVQRN